MMFSSRGDIASSHGIGPSSASSPAPSSPLPPRPTAPVAPSPPRDRTNAVMACVDKLSRQVDTSSEYSAAEQVARDWFISGSGRTIVVDCAWDSDFGVLLALIVLRESMGVKDKSWNEATAQLQHASDACHWKRVTCVHGRVTMLHFNNAELEGSLPPHVAALGDLVKLILYDNPALSGTVPTQLGLLCKLESLQVHYSNLSGTVPLELGNLPELRELLLTDTSLSGTVPDAICNLEHLQQLAATCKTNENGNIPSLQCSCCKCKGVRRSHAASVVVRSKK